MRGAAPVVLVLVGFGLTLRVFLVGAVCMTGRDSWPRLIANLAARSEPSPTASRVASQWCAWLWIWVGVGGCVR